MSFDFMEDFEDDRYDDDLAYEAWVDSQMDTQEWLFDETPIAFSDELVIPGVLPENHVPGQFDIYDMLYPNTEDLEAF